MLGHDGQFQKFFLPIKRFITPMAYTDGQKVNFVSLYIIHYVLYSVCVVCFSILYDNISLI